MGGSRNWRFRVEETGLDQVTVGSTSKDGSDHRTCARPRGFQQSAPQKEHPNGPTAVGESPSWPDKPRQPFET